MIGSAAAQRESVSPETSFGLFGFAIAHTVTYMHMQSSTGCTATRYHCLYGTTDSTTRIRHSAYSSPDYWPELPIPASASMPSSSDCGASAGGGDAADSGDAACALSASLYASRAAFS